MHVKNWCVTLYFSTCVIFKSLKIRFTGLRFLWRRLHSLSLGVMDSSRRGHRLGEILKSVQIFIIYRFLGYIFRYMNLYVVAMGQYSLNRVFWWADIHHLRLEIDTRTNSHPGKPQVICKGNKNYNKKIVQFYLCLILIVIYDGNPKGWGCISVGRFCA